MHGARWIWVAMSVRGKGRVRMCIVIEGGENVCMWELRGGVRSVCVRWG